MSLCLNLIFSWIKKNTLHSKGKHYLYFILDVILVLSINLLNCEYEYIFIFLTFIYLLIFRQQDLKTRLFLPQSEIFFKIAQIHLIFVHLKLKRDLTFTYFYKNTE